MIPQLEPLSNALRFAEARLAYGLQQVPDERLTWSVGGSANTPLQIAGKAANMVGFIGTALANRAMPAPGAGSFPPASETRQAALDRLSASFETLQSALAGLGEEDLAKTLRAPWGQELPLGEWIAFTNQVVGYWQGQLNLTQLAYGDEAPNIPPQFTPQSG